MAFYCQADGATGIACQVSGLRRAREARRCNLA